MEPPAESSRGMMQIKGAEGRLSSTSTSMGALSATLRLSSHNNKDKDDVIDDYLQIDPSLSFALESGDHANFDDDLPEDFLASTTRADSPPFDGNYLGSNHRKNVFTPKTTRYQHNLTTAPKSRNGGRPSDLLTDLRNNDNYQVQVSPTAGFASHNLEEAQELTNGANCVSSNNNRNSSNLNGGQVLEVKTEAEPDSNRRVMSTAELATSMISSLEGEDCSDVQKLNNQEQSPLPSMLKQNNNYGVRDEYGPVVAKKTKLDMSDSSLNDELLTQTVTMPKSRTSPKKFKIEAGASEQRSTRRDSSIIKYDSNNQSFNEMPNGMIDDYDESIVIDTVELCKRISNELKRFKIPQVLFAEKIIGRSQGTLSDLLRNPKVWDQLKTGKTTFRKMFNWIQLPLEHRLGVLGMDASGNRTDTPSPLRNVLERPSPAPNARHTSKTRRYDSECGSGSKKPRLIFSDVQKRTLQAIFKETERPSKDMQQTIAEHLNLEISTVSNYFMNARRRSRNFQLKNEFGDGDDEEMDDEMSTITPPPETRKRSNGSRKRHAHSEDYREVDDDDDM
uniref:One cut domain family member n=1 Tax=Rhabditophanes sp. KR3021 TaxID=114890 RepID=A0AC35TNE1_9BILA